MGIKCGIVGLPNVGKSTLFNALTQAQNAAAANYPFCTIDPNVGVVPVPDLRLAALAAIVEAGEDPADHGRVRRHRRARGGRVEGRRPRQQVPGAHPRDGRDRARRALLRERRHRARRGPHRSARATSTSSTPSSALADLDTVERGLQPRREGARRPATRTRSRLRDVLKRMRAHLDRASRRARCRVDADRAPAAARDCT